MKRGNKILQTLESRRTRDESTPTKAPAGEPFVATSACSGVTIRLEIDDFDRFGVVLRGMSLDLSKARTQPSLDEWVTGLERVSQLPGTVSLIEHDSTSSQAVFRNEPDRERQFVELRLDLGSKLTLDCFDVDEKTASRRVKALNLSREAFVALVDELCDIIESD